MSNLGIILNFVGSLFPVIFPKSEFKPQRLFAVVVFSILVGIGVHFFGVDITEDMIDMTEQVVDLTEESK